MLQIRYSYLIRVISFTLVLLLGSSLIITTETDYVSQIVKSLCYVLDSSKRGVFIWFICSVVATFNYLVVTRKNPDAWKFIISTSNAFVNTVSTIATLGVVLNSSLAILSALLKELNGQQKFFIGIGYVDYYSIFVGIFFPLIWSFLEIWKMIVLIWSFQLDDSSDIVAIPENQTNNKSSNINPTE